ncbi:hypothetical protein GOP47_0026097 [Adiantum capillus-veneris]|uniref:Exostosin GT47 domain-containing protein n=1 Tax=Adiantum capillus-veneris TaxID=13818 RepID=A0A9D4U2G0_ADICA|nr:hypothetical protein GOP47_0026097 [Adiantum capillus-veneris]
MIRKSKTLCICGGHRSSPAPARLFIFFCPVFATVFFCLWAACNSVLPTTPHRVDCSGRNDIDAACNAIVRINAGIAPHTAARTQRASTIANGGSGLPTLKLKDRQHISLLPSKPFSSVKPVEVTGDARQNYNPHPQNLSTVTTLSSSSPWRNDAQKGASNIQSRRPPTQDETYVDSSEEVDRIIRDLRRPLSMEKKSEIAPFNSKAGMDCKGKHIFIYDLPSKFNLDLLDRCLKLLPWQNMCEFFSNSGMGRILATSQTDKTSSRILVPSGVWYETHQYALEVLFHERLKHYKCLTTSPELANLYYIPYYGGMDVLRWLFVQNVSSAQLDELGLELIRWLERQPTWRRKEGLDHVLVLGKVTWDFRRLPSTRTMWGSSLLLQDEMQNLTKLLIERQPWHENDVGVPHPTFFHPRHDKDIRAWQDHIGKEKRNHLVSFAGQPRPQQRESIRSHLIRQCMSSVEMIGSSSDSACHFMDCGRDRCLHPNTTMNLFIHSEFCMQPPGDSPTRRSIFDSLIGGCIPVLFDPYSAYYQYPWHLPSKPESYSVYIPAEGVRNGKVNVINELRKIPVSVRQKMRHRIIYDIMPGLVYARPDARLKKIDDAFLVSLRGLFARASERLMRRGQVLKDREGIGYDTA